MKLHSLAALCLAAVAASACGSKPAAERPSEPAAPLALPTARVEAVTLPATFEAGGVVRARATAPIASRIMAPVVAVHARAGDRVHRGSPLVTLDGREIDANRARAASELAAREEGVRAAEGSVRAAEAQATLARVTHDRIATLQSRKSATQAELDQAVAALDAAEAQVASARASRAAAAAARDAAAAANDAAAAVAGYTVLVAPFDGLVTERAIDPGAMATPGATLLTVEDTGSFRLEVDVDEARAQQVAPGQRVDVQIDGGSPDAWTAARIFEIARIDPRSHGFRVKIDLPERQGGYASGSFGRARFGLASRSTLMVPASAAVRRGQLTFVFVVDADNRARLQPVSPGMTADGRVEVLAGVHHGDRIVTAPPPSLSDGTYITGEQR